MAAVRLRANITSQAGTTWRIDVYDENYTGSVINIDIQDFEITYEKKGDDILEPLKTSSAELFAYNRELYEGDFDLFVQDIVAADEDQFKLLAYKNGSDKENWVGNILVDNSSYENISLPRIFKISAIDGFGRLKNIPSAEALATTSQDTLIKHIIDALEYNNLSQFWGASDTYIRESFEFTETAVGAISSTQSMLLFTRYATSMNIKDIENIDLRDTTRVRTVRTHSKTSQYISIKDTDEAKTAYQVLEDLLRLMTCRMFISDGVYHIQQVRNLDGTTYESRNIKKDGTIASASTISPQQTAGQVLTGKDLTVMAGGQFDWFQPLDKAIVTTPNTFTANILKPAEMNLNTSTTPVTRTIELGTIVGGTSKRISVDWANWFTKLTDPVGLSSITTLTFKFIFGSNRLLSTNAKRNTYLWTTTAADVVTRVLDYPQFGRDGMISTDSIISAPIPTGTHTSCQLIITATLTAKGSGGIPTTTNYDYFLNNIFVRLTDGTDFSSGQIYEVENPGTNNNSTILDYGELGLSDEGIISNLNSFEVDTGKGSPATWVPSGVWNAGFGVNTSLSKIIPQESMALQRTPVYRLQGPVVGDWSAFNSLVYNVDGENKIFVFNGGTFNVHDDEINGEWFEVGVVKTSIKVDTEIQKMEKWRGRLPGSVNAPKGYVQWDDDWKAFQSNLTTIRTQKTSGSTVTSLDIEAPGHVRMLAGDKVQLVGVLNGNVIDELVLSADVGSSDTSMSVDSITLSDDVATGSFLRFKPSQVVESEVGRFQELQMNSAPLKKVTVVSSTTHDIEIDQFVISVEHTDTAAVTLTLPLASDCWNADLGAGLEFRILDSDANASVNNITVQVEGGSGDEITDTAEAQTSTIIGSDGFDLKIQCISASRFKAY